MEQYIPYVFNTLNILVITITLLFIAKQSSDTAKSVKEIQKTNRLQAMISYRAHVSDVNKILLENKQLRDEFSYELSDVFAFLLIADHEHLFLQRTEGLVDDEYWFSIERLLKNTLNRDFVKKAWHKHHVDNDELHPKFKEYIVNHYQYVSIPS